MIGDLCRNGKAESAQLRVSAEVEESLRALLAQPGGFYGVLDALLHAAEDLAADYGGRVGTVCVDVGGPINGDGADVEVQRQARAYGSLTRALRRAKRPALRVMTDLTASGRRNGAL
jgi:hypothetical protein